MTDTTAGGLTFQFRADLSDLKRGMADIKSQFSNVATQARATGQEISRSMETVGNATKLPKTEVLALQHTLKDVAASLTSSALPFTSLMQQGGQVTQAFGGLRGTFVALALALSPVAVAFAATAAVMAGSVLATYKLSESYKDLAQDAKRAGLSISEFAAFQKTADRTRGGFDLAENFKGLATRIREAQFQSNDFTNTLADQGIKLRDSNNTLRSQKDIIVDIARLVVETKNEQDKMNFVKALGLDENAINFFEKLVEQMSLGKQELSESGKKMLEIKEKAAEVWDKFKSIGQTLSESIKPILTTIAEIAVKFADTIADAMKAIGIMIEAAKSLVTLEFMKSSGETKDNKTAVSEGTKNEITVKKRPNRSIDPTKLYADKGSSAPARETADAVERYIIQLERSKNVLTQEVALWGRSKVEIETAKNLEMARAAAKREGRELTIEEEGKVRDVTAAMVEQQTVMERLVSIQQTMNQIGQSFANALDSWITRGMKFRQVLSQMLQQLASMAIQSSTMSLFGGKTGSSAGGLFGSLASGVSSLFGGSGSATGGLFTGASSAAVRFAAGGRAAPNSWALVGDAGSELIRVGSAGATVLNNAQTRDVMGGGGGTSVVVNQTFTAGVTHRELAPILGQMKEATIAGVRDVMSRNRF